MFFIFKRIPFARAGRWIANSILWLAPSMFSVYLIHANAAGFHWLREVEDYLIGGGRMPYYPACFLVTAALFIGGVVLDLPRRALFAAWDALSKRMRGL